MARSFYKTVISVTLLTEHDLLDQQYFDITDLDQIVQMIDGGDAVGVLEVCSTKELTGKEMADALVEAESEPGAFTLNEDGTDAEK